MSVDYIVPYLQSPAVICNQALDFLGAPEETRVGDITDGTLVAEAARRNYGQLLRQLLRANHWPFARFQVGLTLLGDATGQSAAPVITSVENPWTYAYAWPTDAVQGRWMPANIPLTPVSPGGTPLTTGETTSWQVPLLPARFLVSSSNLYPIQTGTLPWDQLPDLQRTEGLGPTYRKIILTNCPSASFVYTRLVTVIEEWDDAFRSAMVALLSVALAQVALTDPKERMAQRDRAIAIAKDTISSARAMASNEAGMPQSVDHQPPWITARNMGWWGAYSGLGGVGGGLGGLGYFGIGYESFSWSGNVF